MARVLKYPPMPRRAKKSAADAHSPAGLRQIPSLDAILNRPSISTLAREVPRSLIAQIGRETLASLRSQLGAPSRKNSAMVPTLEQIEAEIVAAVHRATSPSLRAVINATGVILHTNLGRAPLADSIAERIRETASRYSNLEYDLRSGTRGKRDVHTSNLLSRLAGAESAIVVNNNAAAVYLVLAALARGGEAIVSRGELIEIGDGFRIPDIMAESGAILREVGTTNRTRLADYQRALTERTRLILRVHRSNFRVVGFAAHPSLKELAALAAKANVPLYEDLGSGCLVDLRAHGIDEPVVRESFDAGVNIVSFSADKLLGGPQAGIIAGSAEMIARIRRHPMFRALRVDKLTIAALEASLGEHLRAPESRCGVPAIRMIMESAESVKRRCDDLIGVVRSLLPARAEPSADLKLETIKSVAVVGGGSTPGQSIASYAVALKSSRYTAVEIEAKLRGGAKGIPIIARVEKNQVLLDLRTVFPDQERALADSLAGIFGS